MFFFNLNLAKISLKLKSIFNLKFEKHEKKAESLIENMNQPVIKQTVINQPILLGDNPLAKEIIENLPQIRRDNVTGIITQAKEDIKGENKNMKSPEPEWLGQFLDNCKDIRSKDLQNIWSKILTGKLNGQDTSVRTMSVLKNINSSEANLFNQFLKYKIGDFVYYEEGKMPKDFPLYSEISLLLEIGLIQIRGVSTIIKRSQDVLPEELINNTTFFANNKGYLGDYCGYMLFFDFPSDKTTIIIPSIVFSKAGMEISQFVKHQIDEEYLSYVESFFKSKNLQLKKIKKPVTPKEWKPFLNIKESKSVDVLGLG